MAFCSEFCHPLLRFFVLPFSRSLTSCVLAIGVEDYHCRCTWPQSVGHSSVLGWACRIDLYLTTHNAQKIETFLHPGAIRTSSAVRRADAELRGHWDHFVSVHSHWDSYNFLIDYTHSLFFTSRSTWRTSVYSVRGNCEEQTVLNQGHVYLQGVFTDLAIEHGGCNTADVQSWWWRSCISVSPFAHPSQDAMLLYMSYVACLVQFESTHGKVLVTLLRITFVYTG